MGTGIFVSECFDTEGAAMGEGGEKTGKFHRMIIDLCILFTGGNGRNCRFLLWMVLPRGGRKYNSRCWIEEPSALRSARSCFRSGIENDGTSCSAAVVEDTGRLEQGIARKGANRQEL